MFNHLVGRLSTNLASTVHRTRLPLLVAPPSVSESFILTPILHNLHSLATSTLKITLTANSLHQGSICVCRRPHLLAPTTVYVADVAAKIGSVLATSSNNTSTGNLCVSYNQLIKTTNE
jgi:hypothetical protein